MRRQSHGRGRSRWSRHSTLVVLLMFAAGAATLAMSGCQNLASTGTSGGAESAVATVGDTSTTASTGTATTGAASSTGNAALISQILALAATGMVPDIPFAAEANGIDEVIAAWGDPSSQEAAGAGTYDVYAAQKAVFGFNKGDQLFDVRSSSAEIQAITWSQVQAVLGEPGIVRNTSTQTILVYAAGADFQLRWIFPTPTSAEPDPYVHHISVMYPWGTVNMMAQDVPNPSVVVVEAPGTTGSLFRFTINDAPPGYTLAELEWRPTSGPAVVNTQPQVSAHGSAGGTPPCFRVSADGNTWSFAYIPSMVGESGVVRLIYQNSDGASIIGDSDPITLE